MTDERPEPSAPDSTIKDTSEWEPWMTAERPEPSAPELPWYHPYFAGENPVPSAPEIPPWLEEQLFPNPMEDNIGSDVIPIPDQPVHQAPRKIARSLRKWVSNKTGKHHFFKKPYFTTRGKRCKRKNITKRKF